MMPTDSIQQELGETVDRLLGGRVVLHQPATGYRAAIDPVLLAAAVPARDGQRVLDLGCGVGAAALALAARLPGLSVTGLERDETLIKLFDRNIDANEMTDRVVAMAGDVLALLKGTADGLATGAFDHAMANPPFLPAGRGDPSPDPGRRAADLEDTAALADWIAAALAAVRRKGTVTIIQRADRVDEVIVALRAAGAGGVSVLPLWPRAGVEAKRVIVRACKGVRSRARLLPGLVLHEGEGFTAAAEAILRDGAAL